MKVRSIGLLPRRAALVGLLGAVACAIAAWVDVAALLEAWLVTWLFLLALALGGTMHVMIHELTGGEWGIVLRPPLEAAMLTLPLVALLAVPLLVGVPHLFAWARPPTAEGIGETARWFLNVPAFVVRNAAILALWSVLAIAFARRLARPDRHTRRAFAVAGLIVYFVTITLLAYDWIASLVPQWHSSAIGVRLGASQFLGALAFAVCAALATREERAPARDLQDFGNLLLTLAMFWGYIAYTQYLIVWAEDLPREIAWYLPRTQSSWRNLVWVVFALELVIPFVAMLFRRVKRDPRALASVCGLVLAGNWLDQAWLVVPSLRPAHLAFGWPHLAAFMAEGGLWLALFAALLPRLAHAGPASTA